MHYNAIQSRGKLKKKNKPNTVLLLFNWNQKCCQMESWIVCSTTIYLFIGNNFINKLSHLNRKPLTPADIPIIWFWSAYNRTINWFAFTWTSIDGSSGIISPSNPFIWSSAPMINVWISSGDNGGATCELAVATTAAMKKPIVKNFISHRIALKITNRWSVFSLYKISANSNSIYTKSLRVEPTDSSQSKWIVLNFYRQ